MENRQQHARYYWTEESVQYLISCTQKQKSIESIACHLGCSKQAIQRKKSKLGLCSTKTVCRWSQDKIEQLRHLYANTDNKLLAEQFQCSIRSIWKIAHRLKLYKSQEFRSFSAKERLIIIGSSHLFPPGHIPYNKGKHRPTVGRMAETQFKKGQRAPNRLPIGSTRYSKGGYLLRKVCDTGDYSHDWVGEHILLWEKHHGPLPPGHTVCFKDGDNSNIIIDNLESITHADLMQRNSIHNLPQELVSVITLNGMLKRRVRELNEKQSQ